jgi:hypothetical protein
MPEFIYNPGEQNYFNRFPENARGYRLWLRLAEVPAVENLKAIQDLVRTSSPPACPCLFVSHRQADRDDALSMAYLAYKHSFQYWVDALDPNLQNAGIAANSILTAGIIEMALLNCTHVAALMTPNTPGSAWVPYEYGRLAEYPTLTNNAIAWRHPNFPPKNIPEYMLLRSVYETNDISTWLMNEYKPYNCNPKWIGPTNPYPSPLP